MKASCPQSIVVRASVAEDRGNVREQPGSHTVHEELSLIFLEGHECSGLLEHEPHRMCSLPPLKHSLGSTPQTLLSLCSERDVVSRKLN